MLQFFDGAVQARRVEESLGSWLPCAPVKRRATADYGSWQTTSSPERAPRHLKVPYLSLFNNATLSMEYPIEHRQARTRTIVTIDNTCLVCLVLASNHTQNV